MSLWVMKTSPTASTHHLILLPENFKSCGRECGRWLAAKNTFQKLGVQPWLTPMSLNEARRLPQHRPMSSSMLLAVTLTAYAAFRCAGTVWLGARPHPARPNARPCARRSGKD